MCSRRPPRRAHQIILDIRLDGELDLFAVQAERRHLRPAHRPSPATRLDPFPTSPDPFPDLSTPFDPVVERLAATYPDIYPVVTPDTLPRTIPAAPATLAATPPLPVADATPTDGLDVDALVAELLHNVDM